MKSPITFEITKIQPSKQKQRAPNCGGRKTLIDADEAINQRFSA
jgi:hypothetical protein